MGNVNYSALLANLDHQAIFDGWTLNYKEVSNNVYQVNLVDTHGRLASTTDSNFNNAVDTCIGYAFDIEKQLNRSRNKFLFDLCRFRLANSGIVNAVYDNEAFGSWGIYLTNKRMIFDGRDGTLTTEYKRPGSYIDHQFLKLSDLSYDQLKAAFAFMES